MTSSDPRLLTALLERASDLALVLDEDMRIRWVAPAVSELFGYDDLAQVLGVNGMDFVHPDDVPAVQAAWDQLLTAEGSHVRLEIRVRHADGSWRWIEERLTNLLSDPVVHGVVLNIHDITQRRRALEALAASEMLHRSILQTLQEGVWVTDTTGRTVYTNAQMAELLGVEHDELTMGTLFDIVDEHTGTALRSRMSRRAEGIRESYEVPYRRRDGVERWFSIAAAPLYDAEQAHVANLGVVTDVTEQKQLEERLRELAVYDQLTGLPNSALLTDRFAQLQEAYEEAGTDFAVLLCDIDRLQMINDARGLSFGDQVIAAVAQRLREVARDGDTVARSGGDEFVVLCPGADSYAARRVAESLMAAVQTPVEVQGESLHVTVTIGVATSEETPVEHLISTAASAALIGKQEGRACVRVAGRHDRSGHDSLLLITRLRASVDTSAITMHYQPVIRLEDGQPVGVEALMRWHDDELGAVAPGTFIPLAEQTGLISALGAFAVRRACADAVTWPPAVGGRPQQVAVNVSPAQLSDPAFVPVVTEALRSTGLPADQLTLEVTESALLSDRLAATAALDQLRAMGVRAALDDFGTGYATLTNLRDLPVTSLKIDRSFVNGLGSNTTDSAIVASILSLATKAGLFVVAEGVETSAQLQLLRRLGCTHAQGFLWSPAVPTSELPAVLRRLQEQPAPVEPAVPVRRSRQPEELDAATGARLLELHNAGASLNSIAAALNSEGFLTPTGQRWHRNTVAKVIARASYPGLGVT